MSEIIFILSLAAFPLVGIAVFIFILGQSVFNAASSGLKPKTVVLKALAALAIWFAVSFGMLYVLNLTFSTLESDEFSGNTFLEKYGGYLAFAGLVIYTLVGIGLGFLVKGQTKWRTSARLK